MKRGRIVTSDATRKKIQEALKNKPSISGKSQSPQEIIESRRSIKKNQQVVTNKINRPKVLNIKRPTTQFLTNVTTKTTKLILPEKGSFNAGILDLGNKILCVYRPDEVQLVACFINNDFSVIPNSFYRFSLTYAADPRLILTPDNKVFMSYSKYETQNSNEHIDGNIIMDLNNSDSQIFLGQTIRISPKHIKERQKNWMPFVHNNNVYFIATVSPHAIYKVDLTGKNDSVLMYNENWQSHWFLKETHRGNTNAVLMNDGNYLCTFHTAMRKDNCHFYDNGAYIFEGNPPFRPIYSAYRTYLRAEAAREQHFRKEGLIICTFPVGMILREDNVLISYGDNDSCVKILETKLEDLKKTMLPVTRTSSSVSKKIDSNLGEIKLF